VRSSTARRARQLEFLCMILSVLYDTYSIAEVANGASLGVSGETGQRYIEGYHCIYTMRSTGRKIRAPQYCFVRCTICIVDSPQVTLPPVVLYLQEVITCFSSTFLHFRLQAAK